MGSPDQKQIDGLGGSQSVTSKVAIIKKSDRSDADVDYTFAQVSVDKPVVSYKGNCGNISSGVGPFAIEKGLVNAKEGMTTVRIFNTNTDKVIAADVKTEGGKVVYQGDFKIAGVPASASPIKLKFIDPAGTLKKGLLPTGKAVDVLEIPGMGSIEVSIIDAANPLVFVKAEDLGLSGKELPEEINADEEKLELLETVRGLAAVKLGLISDYKKSAWETPGIPKMTFVAEADDYITSDGKMIKKEEIQIFFPHDVYAESPSKLCNDRCHVYSCSGSSAGKYSGTGFEKGMQIHSICVLVMQAGPLNVAWITEKKGAKR